jgi:hypothetical protein
MAKPDLMGRLGASGPVPVGVQSGRIPAGGISVLHRTLVPDQTSGPAAAVSSMPLMKTAATKVAKLRIASEFMSFLLVQRRTIAPARPL